MQCDDIPPLNFDEVHEVCGGCMHLLSETYVIHHATKGIVQPYSMSYVSPRRAKFLKAMHQSDVPWKQDDVFTTMRLLVNSIEGYVGYNTLCNETSKKSVDALIESNLIHLQPCATFSFDIQAVISEYPIVTKHLPCDVLIMKELLHQYNNKQLAI